MKLNHVLPWAIIGIILAAMVIISGCDQQPARPVGRRAVQQPVAENLTAVFLDEPFQLKYNETVIMKSEDARIRFVAVTEDSRCPSDVQCVWEGQATVVVSVAKAGKSLGDFKLVSRAGRDDQAIQAFDSRFLKLLSVTPYPSSSRKIRQPDYTVTLVVTKI